MGRENNILQIWGNRDSMNLNSMILTNIQASTYFKQNLYELKTYHEVIDEIYYRVSHLEPWEKGSRRTTGLTGMCGGVRGVGGGGIVSTAFCLLYKLFTLKLTRKQVVGLINHADSPYIRGLGFMYVRYTQNPQDLLEWYSDYLDDPEEIDVKAGGGLVMQIGHMLRQWLIRLEWFDTLFPRIPVPIQKYIMDELRARYGNRIETAAIGESASGSSGGASAAAATSKRTPPPEIAEALKSEDAERHKKRHHHHRHSRSRSRSSSPTSSSRSRSRSRSHGRKEKKKRRERSTSRHRHRSSSRDDEAKSRKKRSRSRSRSPSSPGEHRHRHHRRHRHKKSSRSSKRNETGGGGGETERSSHKRRHDVDHSASDTDTANRKERNGRERSGEHTL